MTQPPSAPAPTPPPPAQQPKKRHILRNGCLSLVVLFIVLIIIGALASNNGGDKKADTSAQAPVTTSTPQASTAAPPKSSAPPPAPSPKPKKKKGLDPDPGHPNVVKPGSSFVLGDFKILRGWRVQDAGFGLGYEVDGLTVKNLTGSSHIFDAEIKLHRGTHRIVADITCISDEAGPGDVVDADCLPDGRGGTYGRVTIENSL